MKNILIVLVSSTILATVNMSAACSIVPVRLSIGWRFQRALWK